MKYIFVGDIHGKPEVVEEALSREGKKIFVGDFMDSFDRTPANMGMCLELVLNAIEKGEAEAIYGNHELSYMNMHHRCSGYSHKNLYMFHEFDPKVEQLFKPHILLAPNFLVTHAGLTKQIWDQQKLTLENLDEKLTEWWPDNSSPVHQIGRYRGGYANVGGTFWCDWNAEFRPVPNLTQVFGHTAGQGIRQIENSYCIDCLDHEINFLEMEI